MSRTTHTTRPKAHPMLDSRGIDAVLDDVLFDFRYYNEANPNFLSTQGGYEKHIPAHFPLHRSFNYRQAYQRLKAYCDAHGALLDIHHDTTKPGAPMRVKIVKRLVR